MICGRCYDEVSDLFSPNCVGYGSDPVELTGQPIGQYHCPDCGAMVIAALPHPDLCHRCHTRTHPAFDEGHQEGTIVTR